MKYTIGKKNQNATTIHTLHDINLIDANSFFSNEHTTAKTSNITLCFNFISDDSRIAQKFAAELCECNWQAVYFKNKQQECEIDVVCKLVPFEASTIKKQLTELNKIVEKHNCKCIHWDWSAI